MVGLLFVDRLDLLGGKDVEARVYDLAIRRVVIRVRCLGVIIDGLALAGSKLNNGSTDNRNKRGELTFFFG